MDEQDTIEERESHIPWQEIAGLLLRRRKLIATVFAAGVLSAMIFALVRPPLYEATAKLMVTSNRVNITVSPEPGAGARIERLTDQDLNAEAELLRSNALARDVLREYFDASTQPEEAGWPGYALGLLRNPLRVFTMVYDLVHRVAPPSPFEAWAAKVAKHLSIKPVGKTNLIEVSFRGDDPAWAAKFANDLAQRHVERHAQLNRQSEALHFLEGQRELLSKKAQRTEEALQQFYEREGLESMPGQRDALREQLVASEAALRDASTELAESTARAQFLEKEVRAHPQSLPGEPLVGQGNPGSRISSRVFELELQRSQLLSKFAPNSLTIQDLDRQLADAKRLLAEEEQKQGGTIGVVNPTHQSLRLELAQTQAQLAALHGRMEALTAQIAANRTRLRHLDDVAAEQERLTQELTNAKEALGNYLKKVEAARFSSALDESHILNVTVVEPATAPVSPMASKTSLTILLGAIMSLFAGVGLAFVRDRLDPAVKTAAEVERVTGLPVLADIPS